MGHRYATTTVTPTCSCTPKKISSSTNPSSSRYMNAESHTGAAHGNAQLKRKFFPELLTSLDAGKVRLTAQGVHLRHSREEDSTCFRQWLLSEVATISIQAVERESPGGVVELSDKVFNFTEDQDSKLKIGYNAFKQTPYFQIRENNWTLNHELKGGWSVIYDL